MEAYKMALAQSLTLDEIEELRKMKIGATTQDKPKPMTWEEKYQLQCMSFLKKRMYRTR